MRVGMVIWLLSCCGLVAAQSNVTKEVEAYIQLIANNSEALLPSETKVLSVALKEDHLIIQLDIPLPWLTSILDENTHEELMESFAGGFSNIPHDQLSVLAKNVAGKFQSLSSFLPVIPFQSSEPMANLESAPARRGDLTRRGVLLKNQIQPVGELSGKTIWLSAGHGWQYDGRRKTFKTQRQNHHGVVEDFAAIESVNYHLLRYLYQAGANVWTVRERDMNTNEIILDNDHADHYRETGNWTTSKSNGYHGKSYRYNITKEKETATAVFSTSIKNAGKYWLSVHYVSGTNRTVDARYRIKHAGGTSVVSVNQEVHGDTWVYLGQFYFDEYAEIILTNESSERGQAIIADAVRLGGGLGNVPDCSYGKPSGEPRFEEAAKYYAAYQGFPFCVNDVMTRPLYAEWELSKGTAAERKNAVYLSWHSNANGSSGTETYIHNRKAKRGSRQLQNFIHRELIRDIRKDWDADWPDRGKKAADFGELRGLQTMPGVLLEMAFHDHAEDAKALLSPAFRETTARAVYKGIVRYFADRAGEEPQFLPESPRVVLGQGIGKGQIRISWEQPPHGGSLGDRATAYKVYVSEHGKGFADGTYTKERQFIFKNMEVGKTYYFRVAAINDGGESRPSPVIAVRLTEEEHFLKYLIVDGYDRMDGSLALNVHFKKPHFAPLGKTKRLQLERMNDYSYAVEHARALENCGIAFDGTTNEMVSNGKIKLKDYDGVDWFVGKESTEDLTLSPSEQQKIKSYLEQGGQLLISGSELGYHLDYNNGGRDFFQQFLKARYLGDNAENQYLEANYGGSFNLLRCNFLADKFDDYPVNSPDYLTPLFGGTALLKYGNGKTAGIGYRGKYGMVYLAVPFESIGGAQTRAELMGQCLEYLHGERYQRQEGNRLPLVRGD